MSPPRSARRRRGGSSDPADEHPRASSDATGNGFRRPLDAAAVRDSLLDGLPVALLSHLGLVDPRGRATADSARKIKQISHFLRLLEPALTDICTRYPDPVVVDAGAGKSYLGLAIHAVMRHRWGRGRTLAIESRAELNRAVEGVVTALGIEGYETHEARIVDAVLPERVHLVVGLHACDRATDEALVQALRANADHIALVPCCQAELASLWKATPPPAWPALVRHAWHRRELGAHATNVLRALVLEAHGYQTTVTELAGWEHSLKNELILGRRVARFHRPAQAALAQHVAAIGVRPWLLDALDAMASGVEDLDP